jgi:hypothetical protein
MLRFDLHVLVQRRRVVHVHDHDDDARLHVLSGGELSRAIARFLGAKTSSSSV